MAEQRFGVSDKTTTVKMQENGQCTIPVNVRRALDIDGEEQYIEITVHGHE